jgi:hypothetical protein
MHYGFPLHSEMDELKEETSYWEGDDNNTGALRLRALYRIYLRFKANFSLHLYTNTYIQCATENINCNFQFISWNKFAS